MKGISIVPGHYTLTMIGSLQIHILLFKYLSLLTVIYHVSSLPVYFSVEYGIVSQLNRCHVRLGNLQNVHKCMKRQSHQYA